MEGAFILCTWQEEGAVFTSPETEADSGNISFTSFWIVTAAVICIKGLFKNQLFL